MTWDQEKDNRRSGKKLLMIYAGQSVADNPAHLACTRLQEIFRELDRIVIYRNLNESKDEEIIAEMEDSSGVVIALTVEWYGIGHRLQQLLDACYLHSKQGIFANLPLLSVVFARESFEREVAIYLENAWQLLGGSSGQQITGVFSGSTDLAVDRASLRAIEKKAEQFYRYHLLQNYQMPTSMRLRSKAGLLKVDANGQSRETETIPIEETPEQQKERENLKQLSDKFKVKLEEKAKIGRQTLPELFMERYGGYTDKEYQMQINITDNPKLNTVILIKKSGIFAMYGEEETTITISVEEEILRRILAGKLSFQKAFMTGEITAKGELTVLYKLDDLFHNKKA